MNPILHPDLLARFGFTAIPFAKPLATPYLDDPRALALDRLADFLLYRGFAVVTGPPGAGKTSLLHHLTTQLHPPTHKIIYTPFSFLSDFDLLRALCRDFDLEPAAAKSAMLRHLQHRFQELHPIHPVLILDECQKIPHPTLDLLRLLANLHFDSKNYLSILFAGTDSFLHQLRLRLHEPLRQRITLFVIISPLARSHTPLYLRHHFAAAGAHHDLINDQAVHKIHDLSGGLPRLINHLTLAALKEAARHQTQIVTLDHVEAAWPVITLPKPELAP